MPLYPVTLCIASCLGNFITLSCFHFRKMYSIVRTAFVSTGLNNPFTMKCSWKFVQETLFLCYQRWMYPHLEKNAMILFFLSSTWLWCASFLHIFGMPPVWRVINEHWFIFRWKLHVFTRGALLKSETWLRPTSSAEIREERQKETSVLPFFFMKFSKLLNIFPSIFLDILVIRHSLSVQRFPFRHAASLRG